MKKQKVIIIGAGPAGLTAGYELLKRNSNYEVIILEETNEIGGISKTVKYKGNRMDIGGHRFFSKNEDVTKFWEEIMPLQENKKTNLKEEKVMLLRKRVSRIYYLNKFFDYPISMKLQTFKNLGLRCTVISGGSYLKSLIFKKKETSLENFYINRFGKKLYSMFFEGYTEKLWGRHPFNISANWGVQRVKGLSVLKIIKDFFTKKLHLNNNIETSLIEEFMYPKYGPGQFWETTVEEFIKMGGIIKKNHKVVKIKNAKNKISSVICEVNGKEKEIKGDIFISSMPLKDLVTNMERKVPKKYYDIAHKLPYRDFVTIGILLKQLNLGNKTKKLISDCWIYVQEPNVKLGRIQIFNNWSPYMVKKPNDTVWVGLEYFCEENDEFWNMTEKDCAKFAIDELITMKVINKDDVLDYHREKIKKAYPAYFDSYNQIDELIKYLNTYSNLYCVGRNGQHRYNNMDHSMITSFETVNNILSGKNSRDNIWNVNTEKKYHE